MIPHVVLFWLTAILTGICAISVVVTQNIVRAATWLLFTLAGTAGLFFILGADFVAASQLLIYVGGTLVLVVFGVMLTAQGPFINLRTSPVEWAATTVVGALLFGVLAASITSSPQLREAHSEMMSGEPAVSMNSAILGEAMLGVTEATPVGHLTRVTAKQPIPRRPMGYLLPFEIVSVHLLVVLIGAAYLARAKRRRRTAVS